MEDRIKVNGVWYVKEEAERKERAPIEPEFESPIKGYFAEYEHHNFKFEEMNCNGSLEAYIVVNFRGSLKDEEIWDAPDYWFKILDGEPSSLYELKHDLGEEGVKEFIHFLNTLVKKEYIIP